MNRAALLQHRLRRFDAMREAAAKLKARDLVGRDVFMRGNPEGLKLKTVPKLSRYDLFVAIAKFTSRTVPPELEGIV